MKKSIHPKYHNDAKFKCSCGNTIVTGSTESELELDVCSNCHPLYTGANRFIDTAGRVDKFKARMAKAEQMKKTTVKKERKSNKED